MGNLPGKELFISGFIAHFIYSSLCKMHLLAIHGLTRGLALIAVGHINASVRPRVKLH